jgi:hypothetical protein
MAAGGFRVSGPTNRVALRFGPLRQNTNMRAKGGAIRGYGPSTPSGDGNIKGNSLRFPGGASPFAPKGPQEKPAYSDWKPAAQNADGSGE